MRGGRFRDGRRRVGSRGDGLCQSLVLLPRRGQRSTGGLNVASTGGFRSHLRRDQQVGRKIGGWALAGVRAAGRAGLPGGRAASLQRV